MEPKQNNSIAKLHACSTLAVQSPTAAASRPPSLLKTRLRTVKLEPDALLADVEREGGQSKS